VREENAIFSSFTNMIRSFLPKKTPKVAMFGPGLESDTSIIVRNMLYEQSNQLERVGLVPGQYDGKDYCILCIAYCII
jgi:F-box protein 4